MSNAPPIDMLEGGADTRFESLRDSRRIDQKDRRRSREGAFTRCFKTPVLSPGEPDPVLSEDSASTTGPPLIFSAAAIASGTECSFTSYAFLLFHRRAPAHRRASARRVHRRS